MNAGRSRFRPGQTEPLRSVHPCIPGAVYRRTWSRLIGWPDAFRSRQNPAHPSGNRVPPGSPACPSPHAAFIAAFFDRRPFPAGRGDRRPISASPAASAKILPRISGEDEFSDPKTVRLPRSDSRQYILFRTAGSGAPTKPVASRRIRRSASARPRFSGDSSCGKVIHGVSTFPNRIARTEVDERVKFGRFPPAPPSRSHTFPLFLTLARFPHPHGIHLSGGV